MTESDINAELKVTTEGISLSLYEDDGDIPVLIDEFWATKSEVEEALNDSEEIKISLNTFDQ